MSTSELWSSPQTARSIPAIRSKSALVVTSRSETPFGQLRLAGDVRHPADHDGLGVLRHEARAQQPLRQIGRQVVPVQLPLEALASLGKSPNLARDQLVERVTGHTGEIAIQDEAAAGETEEAHHGPVSLDGRAVRQRIRDPSAKLRVVGREHDLDTTSTQRK